MVNGAEFRIAVTRPDERRVYLVDFHASIGTINFKHRTVRCVVYDCDCLLSVEVQT